MNMYFSDNLTTINSPHFHNNVSNNTCRISPRIEIVELVVSSILHISQRDLHRKHRCVAPIAHARHMAMYLTHVSFGISFTEIGRFFGRDRTTVSHACQRIEDEREDAQTEWILNLMELSIRRLATRTNVEVA